MPETGGRRGERETIEVERGVWASKLLGKQVAGPVVWDPAVNRCRYVPTVHEVLRLAVGGGFVCVVQSHRHGGQRPRMAMYSYSLALRLAQPSLHSLGIATRREHEWLLCMHQRNVVIDYEAVCTCRRGKAMNQ